MSSRLIVPYPRKAPPNPEVAKAVRDLGAPASSPRPDTAAERLLKYVPAEIIASYVMLSGLVDAASQTSPLRPIAAWGIFLVALGLTPIYYFRTYEPKGVCRWQPWLSALSFAAWAYALGGPFRLGPAWFFGLAYEPWFAALTAGLVSWLIALVWQPTEA